MLNNYYQAGQTKGLFNQNKSYTCYGETPVGKADNQIIAENERYFRFYINLPKILTIIWAVLVGLGAIILAAVIEEFSIFFAVAFGGGVLTPLIYFLTKLTLSKNILEIFYLKKISNSIEILNINNKGASKENDELPLI